MSKAFADVEECDKLKLAVIWNCQAGFSIIRIVLGDARDSMRELCSKHGASSILRRPESEKALKSLQSCLNGSDCAELESSLCLCGVNDFSIKVLRFLRLKVPRGRVVSYGRLAALCGSPGAARAVGLAMASNPFPLFFPCHRVLGADGSLTGFGFGLEMKKSLLELEGIELRKGKVDMNLFGI